MFPRASLFLSGAFLVSCFASCYSYGADYRELEITGHSGADIWRHVADFARSRGFRGDPNETDVGRRIYQTRWSGESVAFRRGSRQRFRAEIDQLEKSPPKWLIRYYVEIQRVDDTSKNMRPEEDDWEFAGQDRTREAEFLRVMQVTFKPELSGGVGPGDPARTGR